MNLFGFAVTDLSARVGRYDSGRCPEVGKRTQMHRHGGVSPDLGSYSSSTCLYKGTYQFGFFIGKFHATVRAPADCEPVLKILSIGCVRTPAISLSPKSSSQQMADARTRVLIFNSTLSYVHTPVLKTIIISLVLWFGTVKSWGQVASRKCGILLPSFDVLTRSQRHSTA